MKALWHNEVTEFLGLVVFVSVAVASVIGFWFGVAWVAKAALAWVGGLWTP